VADFTDSITATVGSGGKGGGVIIVRAAGPISLTGVINAAGSAGGDSTGSGEGTNQYLLISGAGGGSGGRVLLHSATSISIGGSSTINVSGGNGGSGYCTANVNTTYKANGGGGGGGGQISVWAPTVTGYDVAASSWNIAGGSAGGSSGTGSNVLNGSGGGSCSGAGAQTAGGNGVKASTTGSVPTL